MKTRAALAVAPNAPLEIHEVDLDGPKAGEVLVDGDRQLAPGPGVLQPPHRNPRLLDLPPYAALAWRDRSGLSFQFHPEFSAFIPLRHVSSSAISWGMAQKPLTLRQFQDRFPTEEACLDHLFQVRYGTGFECPKCGRPARFHRVKARRSYECQWCAHQVYPTAGTPFDRTRTPLRDWFYVMFLFTTARNGVAAKRVQRELGVTYKTAWRMCHEIRKYMGRVDGQTPLGGPDGVVEIDETIFGGEVKGKGSGLQTRPSSSAWSSLAGNSSPASSRTRGGGSSSRM